MGTHTVYSAETARPRTRIRRILGAIIAGLLMGEIVSLTTFFAPKLAELIIFIVMAIVLLVRPSGLFGEAGLAE